MKFSRSLIGAAAAIGLSSLALPALAVDATYILDNGGSAFATPGNYGSVSLTQDGSSVDFSISLADGYEFVTTGNAISHALFAFNATGVSNGDISNIQAGSPGTFTVGAPATGSPFGDFGFGIYCSDCKSGGAGATMPPLTFSVANAMVSDFAFLSTGGNPNAYFTADIIDVASGNTGQVGATGMVPGVPEPESYALMLGGLGVVGFIARRRKQQDA
jgi:hypothetical protein